MERFAPIYFNSLTKTVINHRFRLGNNFQDFLYMIDVWINNGSGWIVELIESQYINISTYRPLLGSSYMDLPVEFKSPKKGQKQISKKKCYGFMLDILILQTNIEREFEKLTKKLLKNLIMMELSFPCKKKILAR